LARAGTILIDNIVGGVFVGSHLLSNIENGVATVTLNRPESRNALSLELTRELLDCLEHLNLDRAVRVIILAAKGPVFCSGHDLTEMLGCNPTDHKRIFCACSHLMEKIQSVRQPVIAQVQGPATSAGAELVATCDLAIASEDASFATQGIRIGLFCSTPMVALSRSIGRKRVMEMLLTGDLVDAKTAAEWGLVNRVVSSSELASATRALAERIAEASAVAVGIGKNAFYKQAELDQAHAYHLARETMANNLQESDAQEGIKAFLEKRPAHWPSAARVSSVPVGNRH
jgi:enoyl-CoA hydratase/carnithine racemase